MTTYIGLLVISFRYKQNSLIPGIYEPSLTKEYDEDSVLGQPFDFISELAQEWENASLLKEQNVRRVVIRSGIVAIFIVQYVRCSLNCKVHEWGTRDGEGTFNVLVWANFEDLPDY